MTPFPFEASRLKVWRAGKHIASLEAEIAAYMARKPAHINVRPAVPPKDAGMVYHEVVLTEPIPVEFSVFIGDIIHNLRTSLDLLACELVRMNGGNDAEVYFPFAKNAAELEHVIKRRGVDQAKPEVVDLIRSFKPYIEAGNVELRGVHDLDILDKHRALVPAGGNIRYPKEIDGKRPVPSGGLGFPRAKRGKTIAGEISRGHTRADWPLGEGLPVDFSITTEGDWPVHGELGPTLKRLVEEFTRVIDAFETLCFGTITKQFPWA